MTTRSRFLWGLAAGAAARAAAGFLLAPKTGRESRRAVPAGAGRTWNVLKQKAGRFPRPGHGVAEQPSETVG